MPTYKAELDFPVIKNTLLAVYHKNLVRSLPKLEKLLKTETIEEYCLSKIFRDTFDVFVKKYLKLWKKFDEVGGLYEFVINSIDKILIDKVMKATKFNKSRTARILGISRNTLNSKLKQLKLCYKACVNNHFNRYSS